MATFLLPLQPTSIEFIVTVGNIDYGMRTYYREAPEAGWHIDFWDATNDTFSIAGIPLVTGLDLLMQYAFLRLGFEMWLLHDYGSDTPAFEELGNVARLYLVM